MQHAMLRELGLPKLPEPHDVADALAIALCHYFACGTIRGPRVGTSRGERHGVGINADACWRTRATAGRGLRNAGPMITKMTGPLTRVLDDEVRLQVGPFEYQVLVPEFGPPPGADPDRGTRSRSTSLEYLEGN